MIIPEQWKQYDKDYWVSDQGRVKRIYKNGNVYYLTPLKRHKKDTQLRVKIHGKHVPLRRLVWKMFRGDIPDGYGVINKNGCRTMNDLYNLELLPMRKCAATNKSPRMKKVINLDTGVVYPSVRCAEKYLSINHATISNYCNNKVDKTKYNLEFFDEEKKYTGLNVRFLRGK